MKESRNVWISDEVYKNRYKLCDEIKSIENLTIFIFYSVHRIKKKMSYYHPRRFVSRQFYEQPWPRRFHEHPRYPVDYYDEDEGGDLDLAPLKASDMKKWMAIDRMMIEDCRNPEVDRYRQKYIEKEANEFKNPIPESFRGNKDKLCRVTELLVTSENGEDLSPEEYQLLPPDLQNWWDRLKQI